MRTARRARRTRIMRRAVRACDPKDVVETKGKMYSAPAGMSIQPKVGDQPSVSTSTVWFRSPARPAHGFLLRFSVLVSPFSLPPNLEIVRTVAPAGNQSDAAGVWLMDRNYYIAAHHSLGPYAFGALRLRRVDQPAA